MTTDIHLNNAPIVEGLIDIRIKPRDDFKPETLATLRDLFKERYPIHKEAFQVQANFEIREGEDPPQSIVSQKLGYRLESADGRYVLQLQHGGFTLSRLKPYETWETLFEEVKRIWPIYSSVTKPEAITRVATRYINRLELPGPRLDFDDYLAVPPTIPQSLPQIIGEFVTRILVFEEKSGASIVITQALEPPNPANNAVPVIIDIDVFKEVAFNIDSDEQWKLLDELRHLKNKAFFGSITDKTLELFK